MKKIYVILFVLFVSAFFQSQAQTQEMENFRQEGIASWYGREFEGRPTASGEIFDPSQLTAAHPNLPFGTVLVVTNVHNNKKVTVRVNDRGPFVPARIIDVSRAAAEQLDMVVTGTAPVIIESTDKIVFSSTAVGALTERMQMSPQTAVTPPVAPVSAPVAAIPAVPVFVSQPVIVQSPSQVRLTPSINIVPDKSYRLQVGSFRVARNAVEAFDRLKSAGLNPAYERYTDSSNSEYFRVVLAGIRGTDVQTTSEKLSTAGFREAIIREEN
jgi:rare lipoprotein A